MNRHPRIFGPSLLMAFFVLASGCASVPSQKIAITSDPPGATVTVVGEDMRCITPCEAEFVPNLNYVLKVEKEGYEPLTMAIDPVERRQSRSDQAFRIAQDAALVTLLIGTAGLAYPLVGLVEAQRKRRGWELPPDRFNFHLNPSPSLGRRGTP